MDEARRFLRLVIPGFIYTLATILFTWILFPSWVSTQLAVLTGASTGIGTAIAAVVASGALGYVFSVMHHFLHNHVSWGAPIDHSAMLDQLISSGMLRVVSLAEDEGRKSGRQFSRQDALPVITSLWHQRMKYSDRVSGTEPKLYVFHDTAHATGTARIAVGWAFVTTLIIAAHISHFESAWWPLFRFVLMVVVATLAIALFWETYYRVGNLGQRVLDEVLADVIAQEVSAENGKPIETTVLRTLD